MNQFYRLNAHSGFSQISFCIYILPIFIKNKNKLKNLYKQAKTKKMKLLCLEADDETVENDAINRI